MNWLDLLGNAASGGIVGLLGGLGTGWLKLRATRDKYTYDLEMLELQIDKGTLEADSLAFQASHDSAQEEDKATGAIAVLAKESWWGWMVIWVHVFKTSVRPSLAVGAHALVAVAFYNAVPEVQAEMTKQIFAMATLYGGWYYGQRDLSKKLFKE